jgi:single-stranded-DNA-specific exonuclease
MASPLQKTDTANSKSVSDFKMGKTGARLRFRAETSEEAKANARTLTSALGLHKVVAEILANRGVADAESAKDFLCPTLRDHLPDPKQILNIVPAADMILAAVRDQKQITVYTDFDVDGVSSGSQLFLYLKKLGAKVTTYVPNRFVEGYGLADIAVEQLHKGGTELVVTLDCGISNVSQIEKLKSYGIQCVVVDHHEPGKELPPADVVVDPAQEGCPFQEHKLAAAGLVWMLLIVLRDRAREILPDVQIDSLAHPKEYLDLAALGTICDMVPLSGLNRLIAHRGIDALRESPRLGIIALKDVARIVSNKRFSSGHVSFGIGPRINAAGRLGDASQVMSLLTTEDSIEAKQLADAIDRLNQQRKGIEGEVRDSCRAQLRDQPALLERRGIALFGKDFHIGVIGIAAQRLVEEFHRPSAVMAPGTMVRNGKVEQVIKGSVRAVRGFHVSEVLEELSDFLLVHGGHAQAGGFSLLSENLEAFQEGFAAAADSRLSDEMLAPEVSVDAEIRLTDVDFELTEQLAKLAPFGVGNPSPVLLTRRVKIESCTQLKGEHVRLKVSQGDCVRAAVAWNMFSHPLLRKGREVDIAYQVELNIYQGISSVQLTIKELWD